MTSPSCVEEHGAVHLTAKPDGGELDSVSTLVCELQGFANCKNRVAPPHIGVLLGPAGTRDINVLFDFGFCEYSAAGANKHRFNGCCADINA